MPNIRMFPSFFEQIVGTNTSGNAPNVDYISDDLRFAIMAAAYAPDFDTHDFWDDVVANEASGTGYTANGLAFASRTITRTAANSWGTSRANSTVYVAGDLVRPATGNGFLYLCAVGGTSAASPPTFGTTMFRETSDGGVTWVCIGRAVNTFGCANPSWNPVTLTNVRYLIAYNRTPSTNATRPLIACIDMDSGQNPNNGPLTIQLPATGLFYIPVP